MKLLKQVYKTREGAEKRMAFENSLARFEHERGYKARHYHYSIIREGDTYRVQRAVAQVQQ